MKWQYKDSEYLTKVYAEPKPESLLAVMSVPVGAIVLYWALSLASMVVRG